MPCAASKIDRRHKSLMLNTTSSMMTSANTRRQRTWSHHAKRHTAAMMLTMRCCCNKRADRHAHLTLLHQCVHWRSGTARRPARARAARAHVADRRCQRRPLTGGACVRVRAPCQACDLRQAGHRQLVWSWVLRCQRRLQLLIPVCAQSQCDEPPQHYTRTLTLLLSSLVARSDVCSTPRRSARQAYTQHKTNSNHTH
jgi:hypothetical protein